MPQRLLTCVLATLLLSTATFAQGSTEKLDVAHMIDVAHGDLVPGAGTLMRTEETLEARLALTNLDAGAAYTVWWVIWNNPELCSGGCGVDDLFITNNSIYYAAGFVAGDDGRANLTISTRSGFVPEGVESLTGPRGLFRSNGHDAEVHVVMRTHGAIINGLLHEQLSTFDEDCNPNRCFDQYAIPFLPEGGDGGH